MSSSAFEITKVEVIIWFCNNVFEANSCVFLVVSFLESKRAPTSTGTIEAGGGVHEA